MITLVANLKGGTGKSTVAFNLALWRMKHDGAVAVCDLDPQATLRDAVELREEEGFAPGLTMLAKLPDAPDGDVIVDVGASDMDGVRAGLRAAGQIIVPVAPSQADVWSTQRFIELVREHTGSRLPRLRAFVNRADPHPRSRENRETFEVLKSLPHLEVMSARLTQRLVFRRSFSEGLAVFELEPSGKGAAELDKLGREVYQA